MHEMEELKKMLKKELQKITDQGKLTTGMLDAVDKLTHSIKSIETIIAMDEGGYSNGMDYGRSYARDRRGRNSDGSYGYEGSYEDGSYRMRMDGGRDQRYSRRGYSRDLKHNLEELMDEVGSEKERRMIEKWMRQLDD